MRERRTLYNKNFRIFSVCAAPRRLCSPITQNAPLNNRSLYKNMTRDSGGAIKPIWGGGGGTNGKDPKFHLATNKS